MSLSERPWCIGWLHGRLWELDDLPSSRTRSFAEAGFPDLESRIVQSSRERRVLRALLGDRDVHIKETRRTPIWRRWLQSASQREWDLAQKLATKDIQSVRVLAHSPSTHRSRADILVSETLHGRTVVEEIAKVSRQPPSAIASFRRNLAIALADLVAKLHSAGFEHGDLHERNIVIDRRAKGRMRAVLLDLAHVKEHRRPLWSAATRDLVKLGRFFTMRATRSDRLRFCLHYGSRRGMTRIASKHLARKLEAVTLASRARFWRSRDRRTCGEISGVQIQEWNNTTAHFSLLRGVQPGKEAAESILRQLTDDGTRWLKRDRWTSVAIVDGACLGHESVVVKRYKLSRWRERVAGFARLDPAKRAWRNGHAVTLREIDTPAPLMLIETLSSHSTTSYLVTTFVDRALPLDRYVEAELAKLEGDQRRPFLRMMTEDVSRFVRKLHDRGVTHQDLKAANILASPGDVPGRPRLSLIDLDAAQTWYRVPIARRVEDLARLAVCFMNQPEFRAVDRLQFLKIYLRGEWTKARWKGWWRECDEWMTRKLRRQRHNGRLPPPPCAIR